MPNLLDHARAVVAGDDADRLAGRREVRKKLAPLVASQQRYTAIREQLLTLDAREKKAVESHEKVTIPLQSDMLQIEASVTDAILKDEPVDDEIAKKRTSILEKIATANSKLEAEVDAMKKLRGQYQADLNGEGTVEQEIRNLRGELKSEKLGNPKLLTKRFINQHTFMWADKRLIVARDGLRDAAQVAEAAADERIDGELPDKYELTAQRELGFWTAEQDEALAIRDAAIEEKQRIRDQLERE